LPLDDEETGGLLPLVEEGAVVRAGQRLAWPRTLDGVPLHAPLAGTIAGILPFPALYPQARTVRCLVLRPTVAGPSGEGDLGPMRFPPLAADALPAALRARLWEAGVQAATRMSHAHDAGKTVLVIPALAVEPLDLNAPALAQEAWEALIEGAILLGRAGGFHTVYLAVPQAFVAPGHCPPGLQLLPVPAGAAAWPGRALAAALRISPEGYVAAVCVEQAASAVAAYRAIRQGEPIRTVSLSVNGEGGRVYVGDPPVGYPLAELMAGWGFGMVAPNSLRVGGAYGGFLMPLPTAPLSAAVSALGPASAPAPPPPVPVPCSDCGACQTECPQWLVPVALWDACREADGEQAAAAGMGACILCGRCTAVCPSHLPLAAAFAWLAAEQKGLAYLQGLKRTAVARQQGAVQASGGVEKEDQQARMRREIAQALLRIRARRASMPPF
jgi:electron transport complex protein RnfC